MYNVRRYVVTYDDMGRARLKASDDTVRLSLRLTQTQMATLDAKRGTQTRSAYLRHLIDGQLSQHKTERPAPTTSPAAPETAAPPTTPASHVHRWTRASQYLDTCPCGADRRHVDGTR